MKIGILIVQSIFLCTVSCTSFGKKASGTRLAELKKSPNYNGKKFKNEIETKTYTRNWFVIAAKFYFGGSKRRRPQGVPAIKKLQKSDFLLKPANGFRVTWLGHATLLLEIGSKIILIDPVFSERTSPYQFSGPKRFHQVPISIEALPPIDVVLISHDHYDHLDYASIQKLKNKTKLFVMPLGVGAAVEGWGIEKAKIKELDWWQNFKVNEVELICTPARHFSGRGLFDENETLWSSWVIKDKKSRIYYSGDTGPMPTFTKIGNQYGPFELTLMQLGAYGKMWPNVHMTPEQAIEAQKQLKGRIMMPIHWGTFDLGLHAWDEPLLRTKKAAAKKNLRLLLPRPGQIIHIKGAEIEPKEYLPFALEEINQKKPKGKTAQR